MFDLKWDQKVCLAQSGRKVGRGWKKVAIQNVTQGNSDVEDSCCQEILRGIETSKIQAKYAEMMFEPGDCQTIY